VKLMSEIKALSDLNLKIALIHATPILYSIKPNSVLYAIVRNPKAEGRLGLVPIV
jgi:hypothetical protein